MSEKTELPTPQRIRKARKEGQVAHSKDFTQTVLILALFGYMLGNAEALLNEFSEMILLPVSVIGMDFDTAVNTVATQLMRRGIEMLGPFLGIVIGLGLLVELTQTGMLISWKALTPSGRKLDIAQNVKNIFSAKSVFEFVKSNAKILLLSVVVYMVLRKSLPTLITLPSGGLGAVGAATAVLLKTLMLNVSLGYIVLALADLVWQRRQYIKQLMMTKEEVTKEFKEAEGDPHIKHKRRELHKELLEHGVENSVKRSAAVVTNPTHLAVAIAYDKETTPLPIVVAKGEGERAHRMVAIARKHDIPVLQNIPLARALTAHAEIDQYIPSDLIEPVAHVLRLVREMREDQEGDYH